MYFCNCNKNTVTICRYPEYITAVDVFRYSPSLISSVFCFVVSAIIYVFVSILLFRTTYSTYIKHNGCCWRGFIFGTVLLVFSLSEQMVFNFGVSAVLTRCIKIRLAKVESGSVLGSHPWGSKQQCVSGYVNHVIDR